jgi:hypothetical protein
MSGYCGYSMSNNAVFAYQSGEKPLSKWTKTDILAAVKKSAEDGEFTPHFDLAGLKKLSVKTLRDTVLYVSSWHHTSDHYNRTDFYSVDTDRLGKLTPEGLADWLKSQAPAKAEAAPRCVRVKFTTWEGNFRHYQKPVDHEMIGEIRGNWCYFADGSKKSINGSGFKILEELGD